MTKKKSVTKIIEDGLILLGDIVTAEARANVRVSKDTYNEEGGQLNEGGSLRDSILPYPKGKKLTMSQLNYGRWQKPKSYGAMPWNPPRDENSELWDNPMQNAIAANVPEAINLISKSLIKSIVSPLTENNK
jgi:hypothetical protein